MTPAIDVRDVTLRYGDTTALDGLSFSLEGGKIYGLLGRNGSGKTSLLSLLAAFRQATSGTVLVDGEPVFENPARTREICLIRETGDTVESGERVRDGIAFAHTMLPLHIAHGMTRRELAVQGAMFVVLYAAALAVMAVLGFVFETLAYRAADWPQQVEGQTLYTSATDYVGIFLGTWCGFAVWTAAGMFAGAVFYRYENNAGILALALTAVPVTITEVALDTSWGRAGQFVFEQIGWDDTPAAAAVAVCLASLALAMAMAWPIVRDMPLRPRKA